MKHTILSLNKHLNKKIYNWTPKHIKRGLTSYVIRIFKKKNSKRISLHIYVCAVLSHVSTVFANSRLWFCQAPVYGIFQVSDTEAISYSRDLPNWEIEPCSFISCIGRQILLPLHHRIPLRRTKSQTLTISNADEDVEGVSHSLLVRMKMVQTYEKNQPVS